MRLELGLGLQIEHLKLALQLKRQNILFRVHDCRVSTHGSPDHVVDIVEVDNRHGVARLAALANTHVLLRLERYIGKRYTLCCNAQLLQLNMLRKVDRLVRCHVGMVDAVREVHDDGVLLHVGRPGPRGPSAEACRVARRAKSLRHSTCVGNYARPRGRRRRSHAFLPLGCQRRAQWQTIPRMWP